jgi:hypothetical protein
MSQEQTPSFTADIRAFKKFPGLKTKNSSLSKARKIDKKLPMFFRKFGELPDKDMQLISNLISRHGKIMRAKNSIAGRRIIKLADNSYFSLGTLFTNVHFPAPSAQTLCAISIAISNIFFPTQM